MLKSIVVEDLFGYLSYSIDNLDENPVTFLIAKNGMGKTTLLSMIYGMGNNIYSIFRKTEYKTIEFSFIKDGEISSITFEKTTKGKVRWSTKVNEIESELYELPVGFHTQILVKDKVVWLEEHTEIVERARCGKHWTINGKGHWDPEEVLEELEDFIDENFTSEGELLSKEVIGEWDVSFISANRLHIYEDEGLENVVNIISKKMVSSMNDHVIQASELSKTFEHDFLIKLLNSSDDEEPTLESLKAKLEQINELEDKVKKYGLYPETQPIKLINEDLNSSQLKTLKTFLNDKEARIKPHAEFLKRLELFEELVNLSLAKKIIKPDKREGIIVERDGKEFNKRVPLKLDQLSSGEQHLIILAHNLIFSIPENSFVLIDEPELSMHLEWQSAFAGMLEEIGRLRKLRFLCATHSPSIIDSRISDIRNIKTNDKKV